MSYTVLARRYRSREFDELVGQQAIARTLKNSIEQERVGHAYLFVGTRGVGKTSMARIFAKALNGGSPEVDQAIMTGQDTDVIEIDAASNASVEHARELIANSIYRPLRGPYKIYIIDEVHMLSPHAFNALLKALEEPPSHVKFILCTTETHKVPATIKSRCQRFDFRNLSNAEITGQLREIIDKEKLEADEDVLRAIARLGAGSMRDALSLLDRLLAAKPTDDALSLALLEKMLGLPDREVVAQAIDAMARQDAAAVLELADGLAARGIVFAQILEALAMHLRDLLVLKTCGKQTGLVDLSGEQRDAAWQQAENFATEALTYMIALCEAGERGVSGSITPRAIFDAYLVRLSMTEGTADAAALLARQAGPGGRAGPLKKV